MNLSKPVRLFFEPIILTFQRAPNPYRFRWIAVFVLIISISVALNATPNAKLQAWLDKSQPRVDIPSELIIVFVDDSNRLLNIPSSSIAARNSTGRIFMPDAMGIIHIPKDLTKQGLTLIKPDTGAELRGLTSSEIEGRDTIIFQTGGHAAAAYE